MVLPGTGGLFMKPWIAILMLFAFLPVSGEAEWEKLEKCHYDRNPSNDGDSFHVKHRGKEYLFRLYFVDTPETHADLERRVRDQADYFGMDLKNITRMGQEAARFTKEQLRGSFTVWTRWQDAKGSSQLKRNFAFVETESGDDLAALLLEHGLARLYGASASHPEGRSEDKMWDYLGSREKKARAKHLGCWDKGLR